MASTFVYGTLMFSEVLNNLIGRVPRSAQATLRGYQRYAIKGQVFPGTIPGTADCQVKGLVLFDLTQEELYIFDEFEGEEYHKIRVQPILEDGTAAEADVYIWQDKLRSLLYGSWDEEEFRQQHLPRYAKMCAEFAAQLKG